MNTAIVDIDDLRKRAAALGITLSDKQCNQFAQFAALLYEWNQKLNLTAVPLEHYVERHFLDSLTLATLPEWKSNARIADIGTGAGFPGIPLKIAFPDISLTLVESLQKRCKFLDAVVSELNLSNTTVIAERGEIAAHNPKLRESFDIATARAVASMSVLSEILIPYTLVGGYVFALKGQNAEQELKEASATISAVGGKKDRIEQIRIPESTQVSSIVIIKKVTDTEAHLPRTYSAILKKPFR